MALKNWVANVGRAVSLATLAAIAALSLSASEGIAAPKKYERTYGNSPNYSYMSGPRTRVFITRRSWLDAGTEVQPGERKFTDYAIPPGYVYGRTIDRLNQGRNPLSLTPYDLGGYPTGFPLY